jgi:hypothetical protein
MQREWQALGHAAPMYGNNQAHKAFEMFLPDASRLIGEVSEEVGRAASPQG